MLCMEAGDKVQGRSTRYGPWPAFGRSDGAPPGMIPSWQLWRDKRGRFSRLRMAVLFLLLLPAGKALYDADAITHGARPLNDMIHRAGFWALVFLGVTLAVTPLRRIARYGNLIEVRRMLGVGTFCYI